MRGVQTPRVASVPPYVSSSGREAVELAAQCGLILDPWQQLVLDGALGEQPNGKWSAFEVGVMVSRQNGKGSILEARELAGLFLFGERLIVHSAHLFETSMEHMNRILQLIESNPDIERGVDRVSRAHGSEGITLTRKYGRRRLKFKTRTKGGGRGLSGDCIVFDEAMEIPSAAVSALMPTLSAHPNPQLWYTGSAVDQAIHANGVVFSRLRSRGLAGDDPSLAWFDWSVDPDVYNADPLAVAADHEYVAQSNPGYGFRITPEYVTNEHRSLDRRGFATERLGVGDWPSPDGQAAQVIDTEMWRSLADAGSGSGSGAAGQRVVGPVAFALDMNPERTWTSVGMAGRRQDGLRHVQLVDHREGARWVIGRIVELTNQFETCVVLVDGASPAASLIPELVDAGLEVRRTDGGGLLVKSALGDMVQACGGLYDDVLSGRLRHRDDPALLEAIRSAKKRDRGDAWTWSRQALADISPLVAVTLARHGLMMYGRDQSPSPFFLT